MRRIRATTEEEPLARPLRDALGEIAGAAIVLDPELHIATATARAEELLGFPVPRGASAVRLLCGGSVKRPLAEALAAGRPVEALIPRPTREGDALVRVRARPLGERKRSGWLLLLEDAGESGTEGPVLFHGM